MLSPDLQRVLRIHDYCMDIENTVALCNHSYHDFEATVQYQYAISFCLLQIGELVGGLSEEYRTKTRDRIQWGLVKGLRNIIAHGYGNINLEVIWETSTQDIPVLKRFCEEQLSGQSKE